MTDLEKLAKFVHQEMMGPSYPDLSGELAAAKAEIDNLRHEVMKLRFENSGLYAKIEQLRWELTEF